MTEDEAKTRWCPHVRMDGSNRGAQRVDDIWTLNDHPATRCIASQCMAWRLATRAGERGGYCGLAGAA